MVYLILVFILVLTLIPAAEGMSLPTLTKGSGFSEKGALEFIVVVAAILIISYIYKPLKELPKWSLSVIVFLVAFEIAVDFGLAGSLPIPPMTSMIHDLVYLIGTADYWVYTLTSLARVFTGYGLAIATAVPLGFLVGWSKLFERYLDPLIQTMRQVPFLALLPVFYILVGVGELSMVLTIWLAAFWWILLNTITAVRNVDPFLVKTARSVGASEMDVLKKIVWPSSASSIVTGMRFAITDVVLALLTVEMFGALKGIGILAMFQYWPALLTLAILGLIGNYSLVAMEKHLNRWKEDIKSE